MSKHDTENQDLSPERLQLSLNPMDGSLLSAPLLSVLLAETDGIYNDIFNMAHGEIKVTTSIQQEESQNEEENNNSTSAAVVPQKSERMANLSFVQRRHELSWRLAQHSKSLQHIAALTASAATSDLSHWVDVSSRALQHARSSWVQADEAQDALFFFHAQLFPARAAPHDVYGALDVHLKGMWYDLPTDLRLVVDRYETSAENQYSKEEADQRWKTAVRDKLLRGEVGWMRQQGILDDSPWKVALRGGLVRLTQGKPKVGPENKSIYPIEAMLSVLSTNDEAPWTLLSIEVNVMAKTGEFNHQLETSNRQRYDLHRLCARAMSMEEVQVKDKAKKNDPDSDGSGDHGVTAPVARPLDALFRVAHVFSLSWQLEVLSAQALALRRGVWAAGESNQITITPVRFLTDGGPVIGVVSISFWKVDDSFGSPSMGDLNLEEDFNMVKQKNYADTSGQLVLSIRAEQSAGIKVSMSGADGAMMNINSNHNAREIIRKLLIATSNPFELSASDALLAATHLCAERKCDAVVAALRHNGKENILPDWVHVSLDGGSIAVSAKIGYRGVPTMTTRYTTLFRLACDARTGTFVCTFSKVTDILRRLASNDVHASESLSLRISSAPDHRKRNIAASSTGRCLRDTFESLVRSVNQLGQRVGVGFSWDEKNAESPSLRLRSIQTSADDVRMSMIRCCGVSALYGVFSVALSVASGVNVVPDRCGIALDDTGLLRVPPIGIVMDQQVVEEQRRAADGTYKNYSYISQRFFAGSCSIHETGVEVYPVIIRTKLASLSSIVERTGLETIGFKEGDSLGGDSFDERPNKRIRRSNVVMKDDGDVHDINTEVETLAAILAATIDTLD